MDCEAVCCPSPNNPVIAPVGKPAKSRKLLQVVMYLEIVVCIVKMMLFGTFNGLLNLVSVWIDYMAYATMHYCQAMIVSIAAGIDLLMLAVTYSSYKPMLAKDQTKEVMFWFLVGFSAFKMISGMLAYVHFKQAFVQQVPQDNYMGPSMFSPMMQQPVY